MSLKMEHPAPKPPASHLHSLNLIVAMLAGIISITGGIYSLKSNLFSGPEYGSLQGIVRDEKIAKPLKLVAVEISDLAGAVVNTATTDDDGHYKVDSLKTGNYAVKFTAPLHKVETKTIKIEKKLESTIHVDLIPDMPAPASVMPAEVAASGAQSIAQPYTPAATPSAPSYNSGGVITPGTTVPPVYAPSGTASVPVQDESYQEPPPGYHRRHPRHYPGDYDASSSPNTSGNSQESSFATVGTQLLSAFIASKSDSNSTSTTESN